MLNWAIRYAPILERVDRLRPRRICDVGSGAHGLAEYAPGRLIIATDIAFSERPAPGVVAVVARAEALPFRRGAFDLTVCADMLEHLDPRDRPAAVAEVLRVSAVEAVLAFPAGRSAEVLDRVKSHLLRRWGFEAPPWLVEHHQHPFPTAALVRAAVPGGFEVAVQRNDNLLLDLAVFGAEYRIPQRWLQRMEHLPTIRRLSRVMAAPPAYRRVVLARRISGR